MALVVCIPVQSSPSNGVRHCWDHQIRQCTLPGSENIGCRSFQAQWQGSIVPPPRRRVRTCLQFKILLNTLFGSPANAVPSNLVILVLEIDIERGLLNIDLSKHHAHPTRNASQASL